MNPRERGVSNIMQTDVTSAKEADVLDIGQLLRLGWLRDMPVLNGTQLVGVVSIADLLRACIQTAAPSACRDLCDVRIRDVMVRDVVTIDRDATLGEAAELMKFQEIAFLPMVDDDGRLIGAVTESDLVTAALR